MLDHFVPQVYLKQFSSSELNERMYAFRKSTLKQFQPRPKDVCRIEEGSTNSYLFKERAIEDFLAAVEPRLPAAIRSLESGTPDRQAVFAVSGLTASIVTCTPTAARLAAGGLLKPHLESLARKLDAAGQFPPPPAVLGKGSFSELLGSGALRFDIDLKYPQAVGATNLVETAVLMGNSCWEVLLNQFPDSPFLTSDFPAAIERTPDPRVVNRLVPLTPRLAVRILPDINIVADRATLNFSFSSFRVRWRKPSRREVRTPNNAVMISSLKIARK